MKITITSITLLFLISTTSIGQVTAVTSLGDTIVINANGTWTEVYKDIPLSPVVTNVKTSVEVDEFSGDKKISTEGWFNFGKNNIGESISGYLLDVGELFAFSITYSGDLGCLSQLSTTMKVKLSNGEVIEFSQVSDTECGDNETARFAPL